MATPMRSTVEIFSAGCTACREGIRAVQELVGKDHDVTILDMHNDRGAQCCQSKPVDVGVIRSLLHAKS